MSSGARPPGTDVSPNRGCRRAAGVPKKTAAYHSLRKGGTLMAKDVLKKKLRGFPTGSLSIRVSGS